MISTITKHNWVHTYTFNNNVKNKTQQKRSKNAGQSAVNWTVWSAGWLKIWCSLQKDYKQKLELLYKLVDDENSSNDERMRSGGWK